MSDDQTAAFATIFDRIRGMFKAFEQDAVVMADEPGRYYLGTHEVRPKDNYRTWLGGVEIKKNYVSAHLIPVYVHPALLKEISPELRRRMQGKSCFNFKAFDPTLLAEFELLLGAGVERFRGDGRLTGRA